MKSACLLVCCVLGLALLCTETANAGDRADAVPTIQVRASLKKTLVPDYTEWYVEAKTVGTDIKDVLKANAEKVKKVIGEIEKLGVKEKSVTTGTPNIEQIGTKLDDDGKPDALIVRTTVTRRISFKLSEMQKVEKLAVELAEVGVYYRYVQKASGYDQARQALAIKVIKKARANASDQAKALGQNIGSAIFLQVDKGPASDSYNGAIFVGPDDESEENDPNTPAKDGKVHLHVSVFIKFELKS